MSEQLLIVDNARDYLTLIKPGSMKLARAYNDIGDILFQRDEFDRAILYFQMAANILERKAPKSATLADAYQAIGFIMFRQGNCEEGRRCFQRAVPIYEQKWLFTPIRLADTCFCLGVDAALDEDYDRAAVHFRKALCVYRRKASQTLDLATSYVTIGVLLCMLRGDDPNQEAKARQGFEKALKIQQVKAPGSVDLAHTYSLLAVSCCKMGEQMQARLYYQKSAEILRNHMASGSMDGASVYRELAHYSHMQEERHREREFCLSALELDEERAPGSNHELAMDYFYLGWRSYHDGALNSALVWYHKALRAYEAIGERKPLILARADFIAANAHYGIGSVYDDKREYEQSLPYHQRALAIYERLGSRRVEVALRLDPRDLPTMRKIRLKVALNPCHLVSIGYEMAPMIWCHALAHLQTDVDATYRVLREHPNVVQLRFATDVVTHCSRLRET